MDYTRHISDRWFVKARYIGDLKLGDRIFKGELSYTHKSGAKITGGMQILEIPEDTLHIGQRLDQTIPCMGTFLITFKNINLLKN